MNSLQFFNVFASGATTTVWYRNELYSAVDLVQEQILVESESAFRGVSIFSYSTLRSSVYSPIAVRLYSNCGGPHNVSIGTALPMISWVHPVEAPWSDQRAGKQSNPRSQCDGSREEYGNFIHVNNLSITSAYYWRVRSKNPKKLIVLLQLGHVRVIEERRELRKNRNRRLSAETEFPRIHTIGDVIK
jgi:hypothetical protein